jgi:Fe-S-cluster containining protein
MMNECSRCGKCCSFIVLSRIQGATKDSKEYARAHGLVEDQGFFLIPFECPHLYMEVGGLFGCDIHETKPKICKGFDGKHYKNRTIYWVPKECTMSKKNSNSGVLSNKNWT